MWFESALIGISLGIFRGSLCTLVCGLGIGGYMIGTRESLGVFLRGFLWFAFTRMVGLIGIAMGIGAALGMAAFNLPLGTSISLPGIGYLLLGIYLVALGYTQFMAQFKPGNEYSRIKHHMASQGAISSLICIMELGLLDLTMMALPHSLMGPGLYSALLAGYLALMFGLGSTIPFLGLVLGCWRFPRSEDLRRLRKIMGIALFIYGSNLIISTLEPWIITKGAPITIKT